MRRVRSMLLSVSLPEPPLLAGGCSSSDESDESDEELNERPVLLLSLLGDGTLMKPPPPLLRDALLSSKVDLLSLLGDVGPLELPLL